MPLIVALPLIVVGPLAIAVLVYRLIVRGALTLDLGLGRTVRPLGPIKRKIAAPRELVFEVISAPYLGRTPRAMSEKLRVWERSGEMVLAEHVTKTGRATTATLETVGFEPPGRVSFRLVRGPVPHVVEAYELTESGADETEFVYSGELGADLWGLGRWWAGKVAAPWERAVASSLDSIQAEAERRAGRG